MRASSLERHNQLGGSEIRVLKQLDDLLRLRVVSEAEFELATLAEKEKNAKPEARLLELQSQLGKERDRAARYLRDCRGSIGAFLDAFERLDLTPSARYVF